MEVLTKANLLKARYTVKVTKNMLVVTHTMENSSTTKSKVTVSTNSDPLKLK